ncbi:MAG: hypothetical protein IPO40_17155 [Fibrobacteres bacterium]|nr:hypothetical protein [Fibrobacterota bacterium]
MPNDPPKNPLALKVLLFFLAFEFVSAVPYGLMLAIDPSGKMAGMDVGVLMGTPFSDYFVPGFLLLTVIGIGSSAVAASLLMRPNGGWLNRMNPFPSLHWSWLATLSYGLSIMVWIGVQVAMIGFQSFLQPLHFGIGATVVALALAPTARKFLAN